MIWQVRKLVFYVGWPFCLKSDSELRTCCQTFHTRESVLSSGLSSLRVKTMVSSFTFPYRTSSVAGNNTHVNSARLIAEGKSRYRCGIADSHLTQPDWAAIVPSTPIGVM